MLAAKDEVVFKINKDLITLEEKYKDAIAKNKEMYEDIQTCKEANLKLKNDNETFSENIKTLECDIKYLNNNNMLYKLEKQNSDNTVEVLNKKVKELERIKNDNDDEITRLKNKTQESNALIDAMNAEMEQQQKSYKIEKMKFDNVYQTHVSKLLSEHAVAIGELKYNNQSIQNDFQNTINDLEAKLKEQRGIIKELKESQIEKNDTILTMMNDHKEIIKSIHENHKSKINKLTTSLDEYMDELKNDKNKCFIMRAPRRRCSKVIQRLERIMQKFHGNTST